MPFWSWLNKKVFRRQSMASSSGSASAWTPQPVTVHPDSKDPDLAWDKIKVKQKVDTVEPLPLDTPLSDDHVRFCVISDTHGRTDDLELPPADVLLHCGDFTMMGRLGETMAFNRWLGTLPHRHKIVIAGNHDISFDPDFLLNEARWWSSSHRWGLDLEDIKETLRTKFGCLDMRFVLTNARYLLDSEMSVNGIRIYGAPWQPWFGDWAFNCGRGQQLLDKWNKIPEGIDVLLTHGPPIGHGDWCMSKNRAGCVELLSTIQKRVRPKYHCFGHIHEGYGITTDGYTTFINGSSVNHSYQQINQPVIFDIPLPEGQKKMKWNLFDPIEGGRNPFGMGLGMGLGFGGFGGFGDFGLDPMMDMGLWSMGHEPRMRPLPRAGMRLHGDFHEAETKGVKMSPEAVKRLDALMDRTKQYLKEIQDKKAKEGANKDTGSEDKPGTSTEGASASTGGASSSEPMHETPSPAGDEKEVLKDLIAKTEHHLKDIEEKKAKQMADKEKQKHSSGGGEESSDSKSESKEEGTGESTDKSKDSVG